MTDQIIFPAISLEPSVQWLSTEGYRCRKFLATEEMMVKTFKSGIKGIRADRQVYWLVDGHIFFQMKEDVELFGDVITYQTSEGDFALQLIEPNKLYEILMNNRYYGNTHRRNSIKSYLYKRTHEGIKEDEDNRAKVRKLKEDVLTNLGIEVTDKTIELLGRVNNFDYTYDYSDDAAFCIRYRKYERELDQLLSEYPALAQLKTTRYKDTFK